METKIDIGTVSADATDDHAMRKYGPAEEEKTLGGGTVLHGIGALRGFGNAYGGVVGKGEPGGRIESEANLSQDGNALVCEEAQVCGAERRHFPVEAKPTCGDDDRFWGAAFRRICDWHGTKEVRVTPRHVGKK